MILAIFQVRKRLLISWVTLFSLFLPFYFLVIAEWGVICMLPNIGVNITKTSPSQLKQQSRVCVKLIKDGLQNQMCICHILQNGLPSIMFKFSMSSIHA